MYIMIVYDVIRTRPWSHNINSWAVDNHGMSINPLAPWHLKGEPAWCKPCKSEPLTLPFNNHGHGWEIPHPTISSPRRNGCSSWPPEKYMVVNLGVSVQYKGRPDNPVDDHNFPNEKSHLLAGISNFQTQPNTNYIWLVYSFILKTKQSHQISQFQENMHWQFYRNPI